MVLRPNGMAFPTSSGSSSEAKLDPPRARALPSEFTAIDRREQPGRRAARTTNAVRLSRVISLRSDSSSGRLRLRLPRRPLSPSHVHSGEQQAPHDEEEAEAQDGRPAGSGGPHHEAEDGAAESTPEPVEGPEEAEHLR